jgi:hypothetical protein
MKNSTILFLVFASAALSACGGSYTVTHFNNSITPDKIRSAAIVPSEGNSTEVTGYLREALADHGVAVVESMPGRTIKSDQVDAIVSYQDVWRWDISTYMQSISINFYNARTGELMVTGRWRDSLFHTWHRGDSVSRDLVQQMLEKLRHGAQGALLSGVDGDVEARKRLERGERTVQASVAKVKVLKLEYEARRRAKESNCRQDGEFYGEVTPARQERYAMVCGDGRVLVLTCNSIDGCKQLEE